ncbi:hypothetical protein ACTHQ4_14300 [Alkalicoccobacillus gibsonii]|uniref:hypothetical protein n=1 Tax=Alkalicoccobacillus gibsonii TaxID=79881 RepID=UPI003F7C96E3
MGEEGEGNVPFYLKGLEITKKYGKNADDSLSGRLFEMEQAKGEDETPAVQYVVKTL